jgi:hypothetical protein
MLTLTFSDGTKSTILSGDVILGGVRNIIETYTSGGSLFANITPNNHLTSYLTDEEKLAGVYITEKVDRKTGWQFICLEEEWTRGYLQEIQDFMECATTGRQPLADLGLAYETIKVSYAGYGPPRKAGVSRCRLSASSARDRRARGGRHLSFHNAGAADLQDISLRLKSAPAPRGSRHFFTHRPMLRAYRRLTGNFPRFLLQLLLCGGREDANRCRNPCISSIRSLIFRAISALKCSGPGALPRPRRWRTLRLRPSPGSRRAILRSGFVTRTCRRSISTLRPILSASPARSANGAA